MINLYHGSYLKIDRIDLFLVPSLLDDLIKELRPDPAVPARKIDCYVENIGFRRHQDDAAEAADHPGAV